MAEKKEEAKMLWDRMKPVAEMEMMELPPALHQRSMYLTSGVT